MQFYLFTPAPNALHKIEQEFARHRLDARRQSLIVYIAREDLSNKFNLK